MRTALLLGLLVALVAPPRPASAEGAGAPMVLWDRAREALEQGRLDEAERLLEEVYEARPSGRAACEVAEVARLRGRLEEAVGWLDRCAADEELEPAERARAADEARALRLRSGALAFDGGAQGERVEVDGEVVGIVPIEEDVTLPAGPRALAVRAETGSVRAERRVHVVGGSTTRVDLDALGSSPEEAPAPRTAPAWALWTCLSLSLAAGAGTGVGLWYDVRFSGEAGREEEAEAGRLASALLGSVAGAALAAAVALIPYVLAGRARAATRPSAGGWTRPWARGSSPVLGLDPARWP